MPEMGKPRTLQEQAFGNVKMAPKRNSNRLAGGREVNANEKERLLNKLTGYKQKSIYKEGPHNKMGKDEFLKLLTHQLKHQDPMKPMDQSKMTGELAQFSQLEQLANLNSKFDKMNRNDNVEDQFYGASFLGKEVVTTGRTLKHEGEGTQADILFNLEKNASKVLVRIYDGNNAMVGEMWKENIGRGNQSVTWDGIQLDSTPAAAGDYSVGVYAWDYTAEPIEVKTKVTGTVESVFFENGQTVLQVDGKKVFLRDVDSFHMPGQNAKVSPKTNGPKVNAGASMGGLNMKGIDPAKIQKAMQAAQGAPAKNNAPANSLPSNLPIAPQMNSKVNLKQTPNKAQGMRAYNQVDTGLTDVYDVE
jgi:flagellar basal-body rod modification protein FlgD